MKRELIWRNEKKIDGDLSIVSAEIRLDFRLGAKVSEREREVRAETFSRLQSTLDGEEEEKVIVLD